MVIGNILLGIVTLCTMISYMPQIIKLIKTKSSEDLSVPSWILWCISSLSYTLYAYIVSDDFMLRLETTLEFSFCFIIFLLTLFYRRNGVKNEKTHAN